MAVQIFAIGGGGFTHPEDAWPDDAMLEDRLLDLAGPAETVRIGYIGHANDDNPARLRGFYDRFRGCALTAHLPLDADAAAAAAFLSGLDILHVSGGTTVKMLAHWQKTGIAATITDAAYQGLIVSGVSAGAICWFKELLLGTAEQGYDLHTGLGLVAGSACPHYHNEPERMAAYESHISNGQIAGGLAIDDGVGVHIADGVVAGIYRARDNGADAFCVARKANGVETAVLPIGHKLT